MNADRVGFSGFQVDGRCMLIFEGKLVMVFKCFSESVFFVHKLRVGCFVYDMHI